MTQIGGSATQYTVSLSETRSLELSWAALTDVGKVRQANEDSLISMPPLFAIADGMGGHAAGDLASHCVVTSLAELGGNSLTSEHELNVRIAAAADDIGSQLDETQAGAGTTLSGVGLTETDDGLFWLVFNIGDSRCYLFSGGELYQVTMDHSVVQEMVNRGLITMAEAENHEDSNVITRAVGYRMDTVPDYTLVRVERGQRWLICSDGLTKELTDYGLLHFLEQELPAAEVAQQLMDTAIQNAGRDNVSLIVLDVLEA